MINLNYFSIYRVQYTVIVITVHAVNKLQVLSIVVKYEKKKNKQFTTTLNLSVTTHLHIEVPLSMKGAMYKLLI